LVPPPPPQPKPREDARPDHELFGSVALAEVRNRRAAMYLRVLALVVSLNGVLWLPVSVVLGATVLAAADVALVVTGLAVLWLVHRKRVTLARALLGVAALSEVMLFVAVAYGHPDAEVRLANLWFVAIAVASYFLFYDVRALYRDLYGILAFAMFVLYAAGLGPAIPLVNLTADVSAIINTLVALSFAVSLFAMMRLFVFELSDAERRLGLAHGRLEQILENMLPKPVADRLRDEGRAFADPVADCSVLFADLVGFTELSRRLPADDVVKLLNRIFSRFDDITEASGLTKIKTIGDGYMVAAGVLAPRADHAPALAALALAMQREMAAFEGLALRVGINSGPVIAGVIGKRGLVYDLWGDTVNVAARMASGGVAGAVQITAATRDRLGEAFRAEYRGEFEVKGRGTMPTYLLED
jgi:class 3 adenylate cyclase